MMFHSTQKCIYPYIFSPTESRSDFSRLYIFFSSFLLCKSFDSFWHAKWFHLFDWCAMMKMINDFVTDFYTLFFLFYAWIRKVKHPRMTEPKRERGWCRRWEDEEEEEKPKHTDIYFFFSWKAHERWEQYIDAKDIKRYGYFSSVSKVIFSLIVPSIHFACHFFSQFSLSLSLAYFRSSCSPLDVWRLGW